MKALSANFPAKMIKNHLMVLI